MKESSRIKIDIYKDYLQQKSDRDLAFVQKQICHCEHIENRAGYYECLRSRGLAFNQIAITEGVSPQMIHKVINRPTQHDGRESPHLQGGDSRPSC